MSITTITAGQISRSLAVAPAAVVTISPQGGATAIVEYTRDSAANIRNGSAKFQPWPKGQVTQSATEMANNAMHVRVTAIGGTVVINVDDSVNSDAQIAQRADWGPRAFVRYGPTGNVVGLVAPDGTLISSGGADKYTPPVSQYDRALIFAPPVRQVNAVKGFSRNINDAQYVGAITDQDLYDTEPGALTVGMNYNATAPTTSTSKAISFPWGKMLWDLGAGESLLIQMRVKTVAAAGTVNLCGNYNATDGGFSIGLYDPANATVAIQGVPYFNYKAQGAAAQSLNIPAAFVTATTVTTPPIPTDTYFNLTVHVDGASRMLTAYINGQPHLNAGVSQLNPGSSLQTVNHNFGLGHIPADDTYTTFLAKAARFQAFRMAVLPSGLQFANVGLLDWHFNNNPRVLFSDAAYLGGI